SHEIDPFTPGGGEKLAAVLEVSFLGRVPLDREISSRADKGESFSILELDLPSVKAFNAIVRKCEDFVNAKV
ncbi:MAG: P-loop NTPase, partial [Nitrospirae bacterium]|nr:P-loop NTPase [Nitrospirota bacterium]